MTATTTTADESAPTMAEALNRALRDSLSRDERTLVFGEDVGALGGIFGVTRGLQEEFGRERVFNTPSAEAGIAGISIGLALAGWRPIAEMQFDGFSYPALDQVICHLAKYRNRSRGRTQVPAVIRIPFGGGMHGKEHHAESPETYYAHTPGLKVVAPSNAADAYEMLVQAVADPDPVVFLEPKSRYESRDAFASHFGDSPYPLFRARAIREGNTCTVFSYGAMVARCLEAADALVTEGIEAEIVDLRSLSPLDVEAIGASVRRTGRAVVVHEAPLSLGLGAEVSARIMEEAFDFLEAPVARVAGYDTPYPPASLEDEWFPSVERIANAIRRVARY